jgi:hypothetical protein
MSGLPPVGTGLPTFRIGSFVPIFSREPAFLLRGLSYMREYHWNVPIVPRSELAAWMVVAVS